MLTFGETQMLWDLRGRTEALRAADESPPVAG
jgi:hypothetical protein